MIHGCLKSQVYVSSPKSQFSFLYPTPGRAWVWASKSDSIGATVEDKDDSKK